MKTMKLLLPFLAVLAYGPSQAATPILGSELASFAVLGYSTVTNTGATTLTGNLGVYSGTAITGFFGTVENDGPGVVIGAIHQSDAFAQTAHVQLGDAKTFLAAMTSPISQSIGAALSGPNTLSPGLYDASAGFVLSGTLTLDGGGDPNALWVFRMPSSLTTASSSLVSVTNTGLGTGAVYWDVGSSATLGTYSTFAGNILANAAITMTTGATLNGRALAYTEAVTMDTNTVMAVPEPETYAMMLAGLGLLGFMARRRKAS